MCLVGGILISFFCSLSLLALLLFLTTCTPLSMRLATLFSMLGAVYRDLSLLKSEPAAVAFLQEQWRDNSVVLELEDFMNRLLEEGILDMGRGMHQCLRLEYFQVRCRVGEPPPPFSTTSSSNALHTEPLPCQEGKYLERVLRLFARSPQEHRFGGRLRQPDSRPCGRVQGQTSPHGQHIGGSRDG